MKRASPFDKLRVRPIFSNLMVSLSNHEVMRRRTPIHPGEHLAEALTDLGLSAAAFARQIAVPVNRVTGILNGKRAITADTALRLGHWFGSCADYWLNLQKIYELRLAERANGAQIAKLPRRAA